MSIRIKVARTAKELEDVYKLRYQVYVEGEGYFKDAPGGVVVDPFDSLSKVENIIAYSEEDHTPIGTIRANCDSEVLLPCDELFDFGDYRRQVNEERARQGLPPALFGSAGMLAIVEAYRNRRDVFRSLLKMSCDISNSWDVTHIVATVNAKTASIYKSLGWEFLGDEIWVPSIGEHVLPIAIESERISAWAFGSFSDKSDLIRGFSGNFEWLLCGVDSQIFKEGDPGNEAYLVAGGVVGISLEDENAEKGLAVTNLAKGALFGELSLIDGLPRAASARAKTNSELIVLSREIFWRRIRENPDCLSSVLNLFCTRLRETNQRTFLYAHSSTTQRLEFFLNKLFGESIQSKKDPKVWASKTLVEEFASMSNATLSEAEAFLRERETQGMLKVGKKELQFYPDSEL